ncbi:helix-turn-helix domain-containing protein [Gordonia aichiensis]|uniref:helix-turn-helix domain-containing protein n=1 Tax=Gordonia aichiensis TaxID=36820 RepID=UPI0032638834
MAGKRTELGPTGEAVRVNVRSHRERQNLTYAEVSRRLAALDRPIPTLGLRRIEEGARKVDADDLLALAVVLNIPPIALLMPDAGTSDADVDTTGLGRVQAREAWAWLRADQRPMKTGESSRETIAWLSARPQFAVSAVERGILDDISDGSHRINEILQRGQDGDD